MSTSLLFIIAGIIIAILGIFGVTFGLNLAQTTLVVLVLGLASLLPSRPL